MASALYSTQFLCLQSLGAGHSATVYYNSIGAPATFVIRDIAVYFGSPSPVASNSCVLTLSRVDSGIPTSWAYNSGVTESVNPIYIHDSVSITTKNYLAETGVLDVFTFHNTSQTLDILTANVDVTISGWCLPGTPSSQFSFTVA